MLGVVVQFPAFRAPVSAPLHWRIGDMGLCGSSLVQVVALDGGVAMVVGQGRFGTWSIWMEAARLKPVELWNYAAPAFAGCAEAPTPSAGHPA